MPIGIKRKFLPISIICLICSTTLGLKVNGAVTNGADIYCFMRNGGNTHEPSWEAAYQFIKKSYLKLGEVIFLLLSYFAFLYD